VRRILVVLAAAFVVMAGLAPLASSSPSAGLAGPPNYCKQDGPSYRYVVLYRPRTPKDAAGTEIYLRCGSMFSYYPQIGVAIVDSKEKNFAQLIGERRAYSAQKDIDSAAGAKKMALRERDREKLRTPAHRSAAGTDLSDQQWDMDAIGAKKANKINPGSRDVTVGVIDSGIQPDHPDLAKAIDPAKSAGCLTGRPSTNRADWAPTNSEHGTHVAGTIAAADDGSGITGIAPGVRLASVKVVNDDGYILPQAAICGFMWAAKQGFQVTNSSYYVDPGMFFCPNQPGDAAAYEAVRRAVDYAAGRNVLNVTSAGNSASDTANPAADPNRPHPVDSSCKALPNGLPGMVATSAVGYAGTKSSYSSWGIVDVTAPGGDDQQAPPKGKGPACPISTVLNGGYGGLCGTSMASPHAAGVAALLASTHPGASRGELRSLLTGEADPVPCPRDDKVCTGTPRDNNYYGSGRVNALKAVS
jgi:subtilisin family serine protease